MIYKYWLLVIALMNTSRTVIDSDLFVVRLRYQADSRTLVFDGNGLIHLRLNKARG